MSSPRLPDAPADPKIAQERVRREALKLGQIDQQVAGSFGLSGGSTGVPDKFNLGALNTSIKGRGLAELNKERDAALTAFDVDIKRQQAEAVTRGGEGGPGPVQKDIDFGRSAINKRFADRATAGGLNVSEEDKLERKRQTTHNSLVDLIGRRRSRLGVSTTGRS